MGNILAIHWAATTHDIWLHGDPRSSWRHGRLIGPDPYLEAESRARLVDEAVVLDAAEQKTVAVEFGAIVRERQHRVFAATIQCTHVHIVFAPLRENLDTVVARLKRRSAAAVLARRRELAARRQLTKHEKPAETAGLDSRPILGRWQHSRPILGRSQPVPRSLWTSGKFPVFVFDDRHLINAIEYVRDHNRGLGLAADPFDWIEPLYPAGEIAGERCDRNVHEVLPF